MDQTENKPKKSKFGASTLIFAVIIVLVLALAGTTMFKVDDTEQAVITRFGKYYKTVGAGLHLKAPFGIDKSYNVPIKVVQTEQFGFQTIKAGQVNQYKNGITKESTMLTGDLNIVDVEWSIQYRIVDPVAWLFNVQERKRRSNLLFAAALSMFLNPASRTIAFVHQLQIEMRTSLPLYF